ncbi:MAG: hypothetical protein P1P69_04105, partial [Methanosarcinaceae archaeon]|nr:hypothetical protein [Methanosarcinaceae archaeon]
MKIKLLVLVFLLLGSVGGASAFEDSVQRYDVNFEEVWYAQQTAGTASKGDDGWSRIQVFNYPSTYPTAKSIYIAAHGEESTAANAYIQS